MKEGGREHLADVPHEEGHPHHRQPALLPSLARRLSLVPGFDLFPPLQQFFHHLCQQRGREGEGRRNRGVNGLTRRTGRAAQHFPACSPSFLLPFTPLSSPDTLIPNII